MHRPGTLDLDASRWKPLMRPGALSDRLNDEHDIDNARTLVKLNDD